jgi:chromosome segregation ATPase
LELRHQADSQQLSQQLTRVENQVVWLSQSELQHQADRQQQTQQFNRLEAQLVSMSHLDQGHQTERQQQTQQLSRVEKQLAQQASSNSTILGTMCGTLSAISEVKLMLINIGQTMADLHVAASNRWFFQGPTERSVLFEDPFGRVDPFPLNWVHSWEVS